ncbi:TTLL12 [Bugula neritina]|uniref:TTLL12 n=1 Tax=Bugula neritina TaxID=10212 RepID=A0A7J7K3S3_BUGNE|nr:TTLL12 [Bugula neritina]
METEFQDFLTLHEAQLVNNGVPSHLWEALHNKVRNEIFDAGLNFSLVKVEYEDSDEVSWKVVVSNPSGVKKSEPASIFIVDHAWTFDNPETARKMLVEVNGLLERMCNLMNITSGEGEKDKIDIVLDKMWLFNQTYSFAGFERGSNESRPVWYVLDELGSRIQHSDEPSIKMVPFFYTANKTALSIFWLLQDLDAEDELTRDYASHVPVDEELSRLAHLLPWNPCDFTEIDEDVEEPGADYFKMSRFDDVDTVNTRTVTMPTNRKLLVWTDYKLVQKYLTHGRFELTESREKADVIFQTSHIRDFRELSSRDVLLNQFPFESLLTVKDLLATVSRRAATDGKSHPTWLPVTYNLNLNLPEFICHFQKRAERGEDNLWIAKPWNLGRGIGHVITGNINHLVRLPETGPYIAMKYIENPVLFERPEIGKVKFNCRYEVYLKSLKPLKFTCYRNAFLSFANVEFSLDSFDNYEKHFTAHNYTNPDKLLTLLYDQFVPEFNRQYPEFPWSTVENDTLQCIRELLEAVSSKDPPFGMPSYPQSRAHYALDFMIKWDVNSNGHPIMVPQLLECNFVPDSKRGCENYNDYFNSVFAALFLDGEDNEHNEIHPPSS